MQKVIEILPVEGSEADILQRAASVNYLADFAIAETLIHEAKIRGLPPLSAEKFEVMPGKGAKALISGMEVRVGSPKLLVEERIAVPVSFGERIKALSREGKVVIVVLSGRSLSGAVILSEEQEPPPTGKEAPCVSVPSSDKMLGMKKEYAIIGSITIVVLLGIIFFAYRQDTAPGELDTFTQCLEEKGVTFYGAFWCQHCQSQKKLFGRSARLLPYVECSTPNGKAQLQICKDKLIASYPTWEFADGTRENGEVSLAKLVEKTSCELPRE